jgi:hypothetical protein
MSPRFNSILSRIVATSLAALLILSLVTPSWACGPFYIEPIFVFNWSPDLPFTDYTGGKIGIIKPTFGRKTLTIAFRLLGLGKRREDDETSGSNFTHSVSPKSLDRKAQDG